MADSLFSKLPNSILYAICADTDSYRLFSTLDDSRIVPIDLEKALGVELEELASSRSHTELMWTLSSFSFDIVFDHYPKVDLLTYVDADVYFVSDPSQILLTFQHSTAGAMITRHSFTKRLGRLEAKAGEFNVQFIPMKRVDGFDIRSRWKSQCAEWCYARHEDGKFGDQKYLNEWPALWGSKVMVWPKEEQFQGPWNADKFSSGSAVTYHFSSLAFLSSNLARIALPLYAIPFRHILRLYLPYMRTLLAADSKLEGLEHSKRASNKRYFFFPVTRNRVLFFPIRAFQLQLVRIPHSRRNSH